MRLYPPRAFVLWVAVHVFIAAVTGAEVLSFTPTMSVALACIAGAVGFIDARRRHETTMLGNLGIPRYAPVLLWAGTILLLEIALRVSVATLRVSAS